jgi:hypothetical protein
MIPIIKETIIAIIGMKNSNSISLVLLLVGLWMVELERYELSIAMFSLSGIIFLFVLFFSHKKAKKKVKK